MLNKIIQKRKSVRKFKSKKPDWRDIIDAIDSSKYAPMAGGNFTLKFIVVDDKEKISEIAESSQQDFIKQAQYVVVVCSDPSRTINAYDNRGEIYVRQQAGAGIENFLLKLTEAGLSTCWVGNFVDEQVKRTLRIPEKVNVEALFPIGYEMKESGTRKAKPDLDSSLFFNIYKNKKMQKIKKFEGRKIGKEEN